MLLFLWKKKFWIFPHNKNSLIWIKFQRTKNYFRTHRWIIFPTIETGEELSIRVYFSLFFFSTSLFFTQNQYEEYSPNRVEWYTVLKPV